MSPPPSARDQQFRALYSSTYLDVLRFVQRRTHRGNAEDVTAEVFLVLWRRFDDAPRRPDDCRAWLFGIARNCLLNAHRTHDRHQFLAVELSAAAATAAGSGSHPDPSGELAQRVDVARAWQRLSTGEQEVLALTLLDDLTSPLAARVLGITATAYRLRLMRARRALRTHLFTAETETDARPAGDPAARAVPAAAGPTHSRTDTHS